jgi:hypothetical protein
LLTIFFFNYGDSSVRGFSCPSIKSGVACFDNCLDYLGETALIANLAFGGYIIELSPKLSEVLPEEPSDVYFNSESLALGFGALP